MLGIVAGFVNLYIYIHLFLPIVLLKVAFLLSMYAQIFCAFITQLSLPHFIPASLAKRDWVRLYLFLCLISRNVYQLSSFALFVKMQWMGLHWYQESLIWFVLLLALIETRARNNPVILPLPRDEFSGLIANKYITYKLSLFGLIVTANPSHGRLCRIIVSPSLWKCSCPWSTLLSSSLLSACLG